MIEPFHADPPASEPLMSLPARLVQWLELFRQDYNTVPAQLEGDGSPEGALKAPEQSRYYNRTGSANTLLYIKTTGSDVDTGWVAYG